MKSFIISLCIAILIIAGGGVFTGYIDNISKELCRVNTEIKIMLEEEEYEKAANAADALSEKIRESKIILASTIDHQAIDNIERNVAELYSYSKSGQGFDALAKCEVLEVLFEHLPKNYAIKPENIL